MLIGEQLLLILYSVIWVCVLSVHALEEGLWPRQRVACECSWLFIPSQNTLLQGTLRNDCRDQSSVILKMKAHLLWYWGRGGVCVGVGGGGGNFLEPPKFKNGTLIVTC